GLRRLRSPRLDARLVLHRALHRGRASARGMVHRRPRPRLLRRPVGRGDRLRAGGPRGRAARPPGRDRGGARAPRGPRHDAGGLRLAMPPAPDGTPSPELAVVIPTRDRRDVLTETLGRLARYAAGEPIEVVVVDDGSADGSAEAAEAFARGAPWPVTVLRQGGAGPATARNAGVRAASAPACLFIGDDSLPTAGLIAAH